VPTKRFKEGSGKSRMQIDESHQQHESDYDSDADRYDKQNDSTTKINYNRD